MRRTFTRNIILALAAASLAVVAVPVRTQLAQPGPLDISAEINGAPFRIVVPASWNGTLIEFVRGLVDKADHPWETENRNPTIAPNAAIRDALLAKGYALAGSARKSNGWSVEEGLDDVVALASYFRDNVANPINTILWGNSLGSVITLETAERNAGAFDGYLATCSAGAGAPRSFDQGVVLRLAYDVTFGMPASWGTPGDIRDDIDYEMEVEPLLAIQASDPANFGRFEFIRLVTGLPGTGIVPPPGMYPAALFQAFALVTEAAAEVERRANGPVGQNVTHTYALTPAEKSYLATLGVNADPFLDAMNARRNITAPPESRNYVEHFADYSGLIKRPVLTLHSFLDPVVTVAHESAYYSTIAAADRSDLLVQEYTTGVGHCAFTLAQLVTAIDAIDRWARSGTAPQSSSFPAELGFIPNFVPPPWLQP